MSDNKHGGESVDAASWARSKLDEALEELMRRGVVTADLVEARPVWSLPYNIMIGQIRDPSGESTSRWVICGEVPIDHVDLAAASTPREAARHFALKWQLDATRYRNPAVHNALGPDQNESWDQLGESLAERAEALYELVENESLWRRP